MFRSIRIAGLLLSGLLLSLCGCQRHGVYKQYYDDGKIQLLSHYKYGRLHGQEIHWNTKGHKEREVHYRHGQMHGKETWWYPNGRKSLEVHYRRGQMHGTKTWWLADGRKSRILTYAKGQLDGKSTEWDFRRKWKIEREYRAGKKHGREIWWLSHGWRSERRFAHGIQHGVSRLWYPNQRLYSRARYTQGRLCGSMQCFLPNGKSKQCPYFMYASNPSCRPARTGATCPPCPNS